MKTIIADKQTQEWKEFIKFREDLIEKNKKSKLYLYYENELKKLDKKLKSKKVKHQFLWWKWTTIERPGFYFVMQIDQAKNITYDFQIHELFRGVPDETFEDFLNWKAGFFKN